MITGTYADDPAHIISHLVWALVQGRARPCLAMVMMLRSMVFITVSPILKSVTPDPVSTTSAAQSDAGMPRSVDGRG